MSLMLISEPTGSRGVQFVVGTSKTLLKTTSLVKKKKKKNIHNGCADHAVISLHLCRRPKGFHIFDSIVSKGESQYLYQLQNFEIAIKVTNNSPDPVARPKVRRCTMVKQKKKKEKKRKKKNARDF